jgi:hypothetical protein
MFNIAKQKYKNVAKIVNTDILDIFMILSGNCVRNRLKNINKKIVK